MTGPLGQVLINKLESKCNLSEILELIPNKELNSKLDLILNQFFSETSKMSSASKELLNSLIGNVFEVNNLNKIEFFDLTNDEIEAERELEVYAKMIDPTSMVGSGGYDDDLPCI